MVIFLLAALVALGSACGEAASDGPRPRPESPVRILAYNAMGYVTLGSEPVRGERIAARIAEIAPAIIGLSECEPCQELIDQLPGSYELVTEGRAGVTAAYDRSLWRVNDHGFLTLGDNDDGWGERVALWVELEEIASGAPLLFYSTHWCVTGRTTDDACDLSRHLAYADRLLDHTGRRSSSLPIVVTGDLNTSEGDDASAVPRAFTEAGFVDAVRATHPTEEIVTHLYGGRLDYVFGSSPVDVVEAYVDDTLPFDLASDHWPVAATLQFP